MVREGTKPSRWKSPLVTLAILLFLIFNAHQQPNGRGRGWTVIGQLLTSDHHYREAPPHHIAVQLCPIAWVVRHHEGLRLAPFTEDRTMASSAAIASLQISHDRSGFWSVTRDNTRAEFHLGMNANLFTHEEREHLRTLAAAHVRTADGGACAWQAPLFERGDTVVRRVVWLGWLNTFAILGAAGALFATLGWVPGYCRMYLEWRAELVRWKQLTEADRTRDTCLTCGYDTRWLPGPRCPECGEMLMAMPSRAVE
jgi:hypothetical protein